MSYVGEIRAFTGEVPSGWQPCDGRIVPIASYTALFSVLGRTYGGNGINSFAIPDLRGRTTAGVDRGADQDLGAESGYARGDDDLLPFGVMRWAICFEGQYPPRPE